MDRGAGNEADKCSNNGQVLDLRKKDVFFLFSFYRGIVDLTHQPIIDAEYIGMSHPGSTVNIELICYTTPPPEHIPEKKRANTIGLRQLAFEVDNIESVVCKLQAAAVEFMSEVKIYPATGKKIIYFTGPDDIILELAEYSKS